MLKVPLNVDCGSSETIEINVKSTVVTFWKIKL
jgi:hypothetical protein